MPQQWTATLYKASWSASESGTMTNDRPDLSSEGAPVIDKTILINVNRNKYQVVRPSWALKAGLPDRLVVGRKVTLTLTLTLTVSQLVFKRSGCSQ
jgi:hypothetical protein